MCEASHNPDRMDIAKSLWVKRGLPVTHLRTNRRQWALDWEKGIRLVCHSPEDSEAGLGSIVVFRELALSLLLNRRRRKLDRNDYRKLRDARERIEETFKRTKRILDIFANPQRKLEHSDEYEYFKIISTDARLEIILEGFEEACWHSWAGQDARLLCPELNTDDLLKRRGQALTDFYEKCFQAANAGGLENFDKVIVRSEWWKSAYGNGSMVLNATPEASKWCYEFLTCIRAHFILHFIVYSSKNMSEKYRGVIKDPTSESVVARRMQLNLGLAATRELMTNKWPSRSSVPCENCGRGAKDVKFMLCAGCKRDLDFEVHYCSRECQKADWKRHRVSCGKHKVSKYRWSEYKFSKALQLQIRVQYAYPEAQYILFRRDSFPAAFMVSFATDLEKAGLFATALGALLTSASKPYLGPVAKWLVDAVDKDENVQSEISREDIIAQLTEEYEVDVRSCLEHVEAELAMDDDEGAFRGMLIEPVTSSGVVDEDMEEKSS